MPKFTEQERLLISKRLLTAAEKLFCEHGLKRVTVAEIAQSALIAKGSFYAFYPSKEELYFAILVNCQKDMWKQMDRFLDEQHSLQSRGLVKGTLFFMFDLMNRYPLIQKTDSETMAVLFRKLPPEVVEKHSGEDAEALQLLLKHGVRFTRPIEVVTKTFQALYGVIVLLEEEDELLRGQVLSVMIDGLVNELVEE
ncbi:TetR/AcrR family transcriptional regulator [Candidatus Enterococcus murrayae]|uniref:TetR/AcrR family transcriptional regulator n=1 Tax=Candidatus Enterococcus murrayae TaxID=2815321 RepID=A0ABS3HH45_9ENTE|nr:TetR/AcrR family transcriptional regulator [Enterococcus sp. MJM16]MBO0452235.1 TetR/AcrR family transcriptional regulator [Enterococcus sp. MJM16]